MQQLITGLQPGTTQGLGAFLSIQVSFLEQCFFAFQLDRETLKQAS